jgi:hypothetical protein
VGRQKNGERGEGHARNAQQELAARIVMSDCDVEDANDNVQMLSNRKHPLILIKLQRDRQRVHVAEEMEQEALINRKLSNLSPAKDAAPSFHGFSTPIGVALLCLGREGIDFDDIGLENMSMQLKLSAIDSLQALSAVGILHGDLALRNIVQSRACINYLPWLYICYSSKLLQNCIRWSRSMSANALQHIQLYHGGRQARLHF